MTTQTVSPAVPYGATTEASVSAVSWPAIFSGAFVMAATSFVLLAFGSAYGLATISPWANAGVSVTTFTVSTAIGLILVQWISSALGGYITGRLRTKWVGTHTDEVFFRDTAHGLITWALAAVVTVGLFGAAAVYSANTTAKATATVAGGAASGAAMAGGQAMGAQRYDIDTLFRSATPNATMSAGDANGEAARILAHGLAAGDVSQADQAYLAQLVSARAGISQDDAQKRVSAVVASEKAAQVKAKQLADQGRKAASAFSLYMGLSMLIGAFIACVSSAMGGRLRDEHI